MRYLRVFVVTALAVVLLTAAQYGSIHLLTGRPFSWLFEASLDLAPPLLFAGDMVQFQDNHGSQAPQHEQLRSLGLGVLANICLYAAVALAATWLFFPPRARAATLSEEKRTR
jgi:hypothetical protein